MISPDERARDGARLGRVYREWLQSVRRGVDRSLTRGAGPRGDAGRTAAGYGGGLAEPLQSDDDQAQPERSRA
jgi:hypothetical protein